MHLKGSNGIAYRQQAATLIHLRLRQKHLQSFDINKLQHRRRNPTHGVAIDEAGITNIDGSENERVAVVGVWLQPGVP
jgi:hypothetical protein